MSYGDAIIVDRLRAAELESTHSVVHDAEFGVRLLYQDPHSGAEHYLVRYPAGLGARVHRHTAAHTIVVLAPAEGDDCLFVTTFDGPYDIEALD